jgi:hypothetical protein
VSPSVTILAVARLYVHLLEGFASDVVAIELDGREIARREGVTSRLLEGHADTVEADVTDGPTTLSVQVPSRGETAAIQMRLEGETHLIATREGDRLALWTTPGRPGFA